LNAKESDSKYRYARVKKLLKTKALFNPTTVAAVLRDQYAENGDTLGMGNPRAVNQLIVHHSVVILPQQKHFYISTSDYQLGAFIGYDLKKTFSMRSGQLVDTVEAAAFLKTKAYEQFKEFKKIKQQMSAYLMFDKPLNMSENQVRAFIKLNSESYVTYEMLGKFYMKKGNKAKAASYFETALTKPVASIQVEQELKKQRQICLQK
jgi:hypothetical protein